MMSQVTIVLPTYNGSRYLRESIHSCLNQTYPDVELVVVDDASSDETAVVLQSYDDPRLKVVRHKTNRGLPSALNTGFALASGEYLTWTSDDNYYAPEAIARLVYYLDVHPDVDFVYSRCWLVDEQGEIIGERKAGPPEDLKEYNCVGACFLYRRAVYEAIGDYSPEMALSEDYEYWLRVWQSFRMAYLPGNLYYKRVHSDSLSGRNYGHYRAQRQSARARRRLLGLNWKCYAKQMAAEYVGEAWASYKQADWANVRRTSILGILYDVAWLGNRGLIGIFVEATVGPRATGMLRRLNPQPRGSRPDDQRAMPPQAREQVSDLPSEGNTE